MNEIIKAQPKTVLEVSKGSGILGSLLRVYGINYQSADIAPDLYLDYIASVTELPFKDNSFDVVGCFQVFEHIPYELFFQAVNELLRVVKIKVVISLPDAKKLWQYSFHVPKKGNVRLAIPRPRLRHQDHVFDGEHLWKISKDGYPLSRIVSPIESCGAVVENTYRIVDYPYHRSFLLVKHDEMAE